MSTARDVEADERRMQLFDELCKTGEINGHPAGEYFVDAVLTAKHYILALRLERERREECEALLVTAAETIDGLSGQQAMPDDWYEKPLAEIRTTLASLAEGSGGGGK
jgi:hypothetical protein